MQDASSRAKGRTPAPAATHTHDTRSQGLLDAIPWQDDAYHWAGSTTSIDYRFVQGPLNLSALADLECVSPFGFALPVPRKRLVRWIYALVVDLDLRITVEAVYRLVKTAGLPSPTFAVRTPSGGLHLWWMFAEPLRGTDRSLWRFVALERAACQVLGGDPGAVGNLVYRLPRLDRLEGWTGARCRAETLWAWLQQRCPPKPRSRVRRFIPKRGFLRRQEIRQLLDRGVSEGLRNEACFLLALCCFYDGVTKAEALALLLIWNRRNRRCSHDHAEAEVRATVDSAYSGRYRISPRVYRQLTGCQIDRPLTPQKPRDQRQRWHLAEIEAIVVAFVGADGWRGSQQTLAAALEVPPRSLRAVLCRLRKAGRLLVVGQRGRGKQTYLRVLPARRK